MTTTKSKEQLNTDLNTNRIALSNFKNISTNTMINPNSSSISLSSGSIYAANFETGIHILNNDPLSVIAGVGKCVY